MSRALFWFLVLPAVSGCGIENIFLAQHAVDTWEQAPQTDADILFVVDDSFSMTEEQQALADGFQSFMAELEDAGSDFHIGVISTSQETNDPDRGILLGDTPFLTRQDDYLNEFRARVQVGTGGSDKEKGLEAAAWALSPESLVLHNVGFLRPEANLLVVFVSDEDDCSDDGRLDGMDSSACYTERDLLVPVPEMVARIHDAKNSGELVQIGAIVGPYDDSCTDAFTGWRYVDAVFETGGVLGRICDGDWSNVLSLLGGNALGILTTFKLSHAADIATLEVTVDGVPVPQDENNGWTYDWVHWLLQFHGTAIPERGAQIVAEYDIAPYAPPAQ